MGDLERAYAALASEPTARVSPGPRGERLGLRSIVLASCGDYAAALKAAADATNESRMLETRTLAALAEAVVAQSSGHTDQATEFLAAARAFGGLHQVVIALRAFPALTEVMARTPMRTFLGELLLSSRDRSLARQAGLAVPRLPRQNDLLSPREREIHELLAQGLTNHEIAKLLFISHSTAKLHVHHILSKLGVRSRVEAARLWEAST